MPYDVFITHSSSDKLVADAVCSRLESAGVRCWIAPRNINPGEGWSAAILRGIEACRLMVLVFSDGANESAHVRREVAHACDHELIVIPMRVEDVTPRGELRYYLNELHWLDALTPPLEKHLETLVTRVTHLLSGEHIAPAAKVLPINRPVEVRRRSRPLQQMIALSAAIGFGALAVVAFSVWMLSTHHNKQTLGSPAAEVASPIPPVLTLPDGLRLVLGEQQTLLNDRELGLRYMPNKGVGVIQNEPDHLRILLAAGVDSYLVEGRDIHHLSTAHKIFGPGDPGEFDSGSAEVCAAIRSSDKIYAVYQADDHDGLPVAKEAGAPGYYASVAIAESDDNGSTWVKKGQIIKCEKPKEWAAYRGQSGRGNGFPGAVVDPTRRFMLVYYTNLSVENDVVPSVCVARSDLDLGPPLPGNWKKFYNGNFTEPALGGKETSVVDISSIAPEGNRSQSTGAAALYPQVFYSDFLKKYVMVFCINVKEEAFEELPAKRSGIYLGLSEDGLAWSRPQKLVSEYAFRFLGKPIAIDPSIIFDNERGRAGWLVYAYSPKLTNGAIPGTPNYMVGRRIEFVKNR